MIAFEVARIAVFLCIFYVVWRAFYNVFFHPLRKFPGPLSHAMSVVPRTAYSMQGRLPFHVNELHRQYGPVVRIAPGELAFSSPQAWRDIYGFKKGGQPELVKYEGFYRLLSHFPTSIVNAGKEEHSSLRRQLSHSFSDRAMQEQEPIIDSYVNLLVRRLMKAVKKSSRQNLREWYNWTTFDLIGDLSFGVAGGFGCLENTDSHPWVRLITESMLQNHLVHDVAGLGLVDLVRWVSKSGLLVAENKHRAIVYEKVGQRLESGERPDFIQSLLNSKDELGLTQRSLAANASTLIIAGSETTATLISGATYFLTTNPETLRKLEQEVRSTFKSDDEITLLSVARLSYTLACLNESLRRYPPVATGLPRLVPKGGAMINGKFVPQDTVVSIFQWAVNHDETLWTEPETFAPERWLNDPKYKDDQLDAMQPFSVGPRGCIGRNLAYAEMRLILAKLIYNFDISIADESRDWLHTQGAYTLWSQPPLQIHLKPVA